MPNREVEVDRAILQRLKDAKKHYLKQRFPEWRAWRVGTGQATNSPENLSEISQLEKNARDMFSH
jgi:hypothetical protein